MIKKIISVFVLIGLLIGGSQLVINNNVRANEVLEIGATPLPHAELLEQVRPVLLEQGIELEIVEFTDYVAPNLALDDGSIDVNFFQHEPYLNQFSSDHGLDLVSVGAIHVEPIGLYSNNYNDIDDLSEGALIGIPNDPSNEGRALILLHNEGLIELEDPEDLNATPLDIVDNPLNLEFRELEAALLPRSLDDLDGAVINTNYALEADLNPLEDSLIIEGDESPYSNVLVVRAGDEDDERVQALLKSLQSEEIKEFILEEYEGSVVPVF